MKTSDFYFDLPQELIAQDPLDDRSSSRLLVLDRESGKTQHRVFRDIIEYLNPGDCLVVKMNIRYQWDRNLLFDLFQCTRSFLCRNCTSYNIASCCSQSLDLCHSCPHIFCFCICHRLDQDRISASDHPAADLHRFCMFSVHKSDLPNVSKADQNHIPSLTYVRLEFTAPFFRISQNSIPDQSMSAHHWSP